MKKIYLIILFYLGGIFYAYSQDVITKVNGDQIKAKVTEIEADEIKYHQYENPDGPVYIINKSEIFMIQYENGTKDLFGSVDEQSQRDQNKQTKSTPNTKGEEEYPFGPVSIAINPLGVVMVGPIIQADIMVGPRVSLVPHIRFAGLGVLMHSLSNFDELSPGSIAIGLGIRGFLGKNYKPNRVYIGGVFEIGWGKGENNPGTSKEARYEFATFAFIPHAGYRWRFSSGFFMNLGGYLGVALTFKDQQVYPTFKDYGTNFHVLPMAEFSLGWEIK